MSVRLWRTVLGIILASWPNTILRNKTSPSMLIMGIRQCAIIFCRKGIRYLAFLIPFAAQAQTATLTAKYMCVVSHTAGITYEKDGQVSVGKIIPAYETFFLSIGKINHEAKCSFDPKIGRIYWLGCLANYMAQIDNEPAMRGDDGQQFFGLFASGDYFSIDDNLHFKRYTGGVAIGISPTGEATLTSYNGSFVSDGKCTRV